MTYLTSHSSNNFQELEATDETMKSTSSCYLVASVLTLGLILCRCCNAQTSCSGDLTEIINNDVMCTGNCVLAGATVSGNVLCSMGSLVAKDGSLITGNVLISGTVTSAELDDVTVQGDVEVKDAASLHSKMLEIYLWMI